jgi:hypothetical protein
MILCVYALTAVGRDAQRPAPKVRGLAGERLRWIRAGRVAAIAGECARRPKPSLARARRYDRVVRAIATDVTAILPARFGTCFSSVEDLERTLRAREGALRRALAAVRGRVQMIVRVPDSSADGANPPRSSARAGSSGAEYLRARAADIARARHVAGFDPMRAAARRWIKDEAVEKRGRVASVYHLIPSASAAAYEEAIRRAAGEAGVRVVVTGPMPAYAFADLLLAPGGR